MSQRRFLFITLTKTTSSDSPQGSPSALNTAWQTDHVKVCLARLFSYLTGASDWAVKLLNRLALMELSTLALLWPCPISPDTSDGMMMPG